MGIFLNPPRPMPVWDVGEDGTLVIGFNHFDVARYGDARVALIQVREPSAYEPIRACYVGDLVAHDVVIRRERDPGFILLTPSRELIDRLIDMGLVCMGRQSL